MNEMVTILKALSDETRLRILKLLEHGELCVCEIVAAFGMSQPKVSFHLGVLKAAGLLKDRKEGKWMHYRLDDADLFKRFLMLSVLERIPEATMKQDRRRLGEFCKSRGDVIPINRCCTTN
jgi:ArsR family transcriptional regulator, arsenate/arsenite/antimonite-responsive transcriptional repressor